MKWYSVLTLLLPLYNYVPQTFPVYCCKLLLLTDIYLFNLFKTIHHHSISMESVSVLTSTSSLPQLIFKILFTKYCKIILKAFTLKQLPLIFLLSMASSGDELLGYVHTSVTAH